MTETRFARVIDHLHAPPDTTRIRTREDPDHRRTQFTSARTVMRSALAEQTRPGLFIFVSVEGLGQVGRLWLSAGPEPRAGLIGRHPAVDLRLGFDDALSLRQALVVVRRVGRAVRYAVVDLDTPNGLVSGAETPIHLLEAEGPLSFRTGPYAFFCVPSGPGQALPLDLERAWRRFDVAPALRRAPWPTLLQRLTARPKAGVLSCTSPAGPAEVSVSSAALARGVLVGRSERCTVIVPDAQVSRVHAVLLAIDGAPHVIDAGSTNGLWCGNEPVHCQPLCDGDVFSLGRSLLQWRSQH